MNADTGVVGLSVANLLTCRSRPDTAWTTVNVAEAVPGVQCPLAWSIWSTAAERGLRKGLFDLGVLARRDVTASESVDQRIMAIFHGYVAVNVDTFRVVADGTPGSSGDAVERQLFGSVRPGVQSRRTLRRYPVAMVKTPWTIVRLARRLQCLRRAIDPWWSANTSPEALDDLDGAEVSFRAAVSHFERAFSHHMAARMLGQGMYEQVAKLAAAAGRPGLELQLVTGYGSFDEAALVTDLFDIARGRCDVATFLLRHGFHGPVEGDLASASWREDPRPIERLVETYRCHDQDRDPAATLAVQARERERAEAELLAELPIATRLKARMILRLTRKLVPLGEVGKSAFLMALDGIRAAARRQGRRLVATGALRSPDDVFMLTAAEVFGHIPEDVDEVVAARRAIVEQYARLKLPTRWIGQPVPVEIAAGVVVRAGLVEGLPAAPGRVSGIARVVTDPDQLDQFEHGEILVCEITDPSWSSYMFVASAVVIDIGSPVSHGAILARELGIPCVINTGFGTRTIRTGDVVEVDGSSGRVTIREAG
jgi:pyruvate,water dikinase